MSTKLIIARHGNTFDKGEVCYRVGLKTDLPLSSSGRDQGVLMGKFFKLKNINPDVIFASNLKRTYQTAEEALKEAGIDKSVTKVSMFDEVDYGPDEAKTEEEVIARIGEKALEDWNKIAKVPQGWKFDPDKTIQDWKDFAKMVEEKYKDKTVLVVTSNGIARFAPYLTGDFEGFAKENKIKISTGALCFFEKDSSDEFWTIKDWNVRPKNFVELKKRIRL
jgi:2,3-bisphosphoglycerate-dependent phosphoglycerate mutase